MDMVEQVGKAISERAAQRGHPVSELAVYHMAAAAIEAMRKPSQQMINAYYNEKITDGFGMSESHFDVDEWRRMIDAALATKRV